MRSSASALLDLNRRAEAKQAAVQAEQAAASGEERRRARDLQYTAGTKLTVEIARGPDGERFFRTVRIALTIPDPSRVQVRNAGGVKFEFVCGPQQDRPVLVEYTAAGILRGLELR